MYVYKSVSLFFFHIWMKNNGTFKDIFIDPLFPANKK